MHFKFEVILFLTTDYRRILMSKHFVMNSIINVIFVTNLYQISSADSEYEVRRHPEYREVKCNHRMITSVTKLRDDSFFISTSGPKYWLISERDNAEEKNSRDLNTITSDWRKIDASMFYGLDVECGFRFRDRMILLNFNDNTQRNEVIYGSVQDWNWTLIAWYEFDVFQVVANRFKWNQSIDGMAIIEESVFIFQGLLL